MDQLRVRELDLARPHQQMFIRRCGIYGSGQQDFTMLGLFDFEGCLTSQEGGNPALMSRGKVLDYDNTAGKVFGQRSQDLEEGIEPAR